MICLLQNYDEHHLMKLTFIRFSNMNGQRCHDCACVVAAHGFQVEQKDIFFYEEDLRTFFDQVQQLLSSSTGPGVLLEAMSDFSCKITPQDECGHYAVEVSTQDPWNRCCATICGVTDTQQLQDFAAALSHAIQRPDHPGPNSP